MSSGNPSEAVSDATTVLDVPAVQAALASTASTAGSYDFRGLNSIAAELTAVNHQSGHLATRRWYYLIPATGEPRGLVHAIERNSLAHLPGTTDRYAGRDQLEAGLRRLLQGLRRVAMRSPNCHPIRFASRRRHDRIGSAAGVEVVSSGELIQRFGAAWNQAAIATHEEAAEKLYRVKDRAFDAIARRTNDGEPTTEYDIQQLMAGWFRDEGLVSDSDPNVSAEENAGNPHYLPTAGTSRPIRTDELIVLDLLGKLGRQGAAYADITWMGYTGTRVPDRYVQAFEAVAAARDAAITLVQRAVSGGRGIARLAGGSRSVVGAS
jgi:Xaa-Pro aminopeptidase